jgi:hypothetical protein
MLSQQLTIKYLWSKLKFDGFYIIEDIHSSFMNEFVYNIPYKYTTYNMIKTMMEKKDFTSPYLDLESYRKILYQMDIVDIFQRIPNLFTDSITSIIHKRNSQKYINLAIITSLIDCPQNRSVISREDRFEQTKKSIQSVKEKIPHVFILLIDCSNFKKEEYEYFEKNVDLLINCNERDEIVKKVYSSNKSDGERSYLLFSFELLNYLNLINLENIFKLSGRYYLDDNFSYDMYDNKNDVIKIVDEKIWKNAAVSCLFKIHIHNINAFKSLLLNYQENFEKGMSSENFMYDYTFTSMKNKHINNLGCSGIISINGILGNT